jgi:cysteine-rich repeat protein
LGPFAGDVHDNGNVNAGDGCSAACKSEVVKVCTAGNDPKSNAPWVVCEATVNSAWISMTGNGGQYHSLKICQNLGYNAVGQTSGTCKNTCGYCAGHLRRRGRLWQRRARPDPLQLGHVDLPQVTQV